MSIYYISEDSDVEVAGLVSDASEFSKWIQSQVKMHKEKKLCNSRAERTSNINECATLFESIDKMRSVIETTAALNRYLDLESSLCALQDMLDLIYPAHREGTSPYSNQLKELSFDFMNEIESSTRDTMEAYYAEIEEDDRYTRRGIPVFDYAY